MVQGLKFLSKKGFNPQNQSNRKQVWEAQQASKQEQERIRRREEQLKRERDDEEICRTNHHGDGSQAQLRFMYDAPPGMKKPGQKEEKEKTTKNNKNSNVISNDVTKIQPGDDAAAAAFRLLLKSSTQKPSASEDIATDEMAESKLSFGPVLQGSTLDPMLETNQTVKDGDARSALEKAVGRKDRGAALTLEEQVQRFPQLKHAPMAKGMSATDVNVSFKPLGSQLRNVRCLACGIWGHSRGDRECTKTGWNPFDLRKPIVPEVQNNSINNNPVSKNKSGREEKRKRTYDDSDDRSYSSTSSTSEDSRRRKRRRKSKKKKKRHKDSKRHRRRRSRSESPTRDRKKHSRKDYY